MVSIFQHPFYPYSGTDHPAPNMVNVPLPGGTGGDEFCQVVTDVWLPRLREFKPEMIFISAGFDAHYEDDMGGLKLLEKDYAWVTEQLKQIADETPRGASFRCWKAVMCFRRWRAALPRISGFWRDLMAFPGLRVRRIRL